ncbi:hypothetical protein DY000_02004530 [Brassica cretica]|uniref:Uncharacterized protein n=1 Tax=Brassica cretica TaxID=69181 RepID=A0ABQ7CEG3_BRACR|nr:hypothetical protein DY000_02004530 [Brassica cretica]
MNDMFNGNALSSKSPLPAFINPPLLKLRSPIPVALSGPESDFRSDPNRRNESFYMLIFVCVIDRSSQNGLLDILSKAILYRRSRKSEILAMDSILALSGSKVLS